MMGCAEQWMEVRGLEHDLLEIEMNSLWEAWGVRGKGGKK